MELPRVSGGIEDLGFLGYDVYDAEIHGRLAPKGFGESLFNRVGFYRRSNPLIRLHRILTPLVLLVAIASVAGKDRQDKLPAGQEFSQAAASCTSDK
jgi:hypothetical protein